MLRAAEAVGARHIKVGGDFTGGPFEPDHMAEEFYALATDAAVAGTRVVFEPMPFVNVTTPQQAPEFVQKANHPAGKILIDIWHLVRAGVGIASLGDTPGEYIGHIELNDAPMNFEGDIIADTFTGRTFCSGEGEFDVAGFSSMRSRRRASAAPGVWSSWAPHTESCPLTSALLATGCRGPIAATRRVPWFLFAESAAQPPRPR
ncbi:sugar phosphate isomerase/epimerase family protein [Saccharopolyspora thermophila]|nr:TIM barrel protein [Saccharopolyspora subtropica]